VPAPEAPVAADGPKLRERLTARVAPALPALRIAGFVVAVGIVVAMAVGAARDLDTDRLTWWPLVPAVGAALVWWVALARGWALLVSGHAARADIATWCRTQALRYLPGGIWAPASRLVVVDGTAIDRVSTVVAENVVGLCAALALGGLALGVSAQPWWLALVLAAAAPPLAARFSARRSRVDPHRARRAGATNLLGFAAYGIAAVLVQAAISGLHDPVHVAGAALVAWAAGLVVVITPSGIGVRELVYVGLLAGTVAKAELSAAAVAMRMVTILAEAAVLVVAARPSGRPS
jgi:glycosyltransferase 2 family protein